MSEQLSRNGSMDKAHEGNRRRGAHTRQRILDLIKQSEPDGISTYEMQLVTGLHRDRIHTICKEYINQGWLKKVGRQYHLGPNAVEDPQIAASLFERQILKRFYELNEGLGLCISTKYCDAMRCEEIISNQRQRQAQNKVGYDRNFEMLHIFEYALKLGAIITYDLIQSIRFTRRMPDLNGTKKDELITSWLDAAINPMMLIQSFRKCFPVRDRLKLQTGNPEEDRGLSWLEVKENGFEELEDMSKDVFQHLFKNLDEIRENLPGDIHAHKERVADIDRKELLGRRDPDHVLCGGQWAEPRFTNYKVKSLKDRHSI